MTGRPAPFSRLADLLIGAKLAIALRAMAEYGIADRLSGGPKPVETLAQESGLHPETLRRVLRALAQYGVFSETPDGKFENSDVSEFMRADAAPSLRDAMLFLNSNVSLRAWLELEQTLLDGKSRFVEVNGAPLFDLFTKDRQLGEHFSKCMINLYGREGAKIAAGYPFGQFESIIDVGGGQGHILAAILSANPGMRGALFDIPPTAALAKEFLEARGLAGRCEVIGGTFFEAVPQGYEAYMVKSVLHDWGDAKATEILKHCRKAMGPESRLLIVEEIVMPRKAVGNPHRFVDLDLMIHLGGQERTESDYARLMAEAGFKLESVLPIPDSFFSVIEGKSFAHG